MFESVASLAAHLDWAVGLILVPLGAGALAFVFQTRSALIGLIGTAISAVAAVLLVCSVVLEGDYHHEAGGWGAPLGIDLAADGLSVLMLAMTNLVGLGVCLQSAITAKAGQTIRGPDAAFVGFWPLWLLLLAGLNALYLSADIFNLYVTLEVVGLSAVGLAALSGKAEAIKSAIRYLLVGVVGSLLYLLGVALLYAGYGRLDIVGLSRLLSPEPAAQMAMVLMFAALAMKSALFPLHVWLPPAHGNAAPAVSALLSAVVVKASAYIAIRLWLDLFALSGVATPPVAVFLAALGAGGVVWGAFQAIMAERLKLLVAYSTVAQIGYLFLTFPLLGHVPSALAAFAHLAMAHAFAKAALFLACGRVLQALPDDRLSSLNSDLPAGTKLAMGLAAVSLIGLPPSGGFVGKWLMLEAAASSAFWPLALVVVVGTLLSAAAMARMVGRLFSAPEAQARPVVDVAVGRSGHYDLVPLVLAVASIGLGLMGPWAVSLVAAGGGQ